jgi:hypothetical protein
MADYNINAVTRKVVYTGSAGLGPYSFSFEVLVNTDIAVYFNTTLLTLTTDYSVTINANGTGSVTIVTGTGVPTTPDGDDTITIVGARDIERTTDFSVGGDLSAAALNEQLDAEIIFIQQIDERVDRAIKAAVTDPTTINMELPVIATRANKLLAFDADGDVTVSTETLSQIEGAATSATAAAASAVAAAASAASAATTYDNFDDRYLGAKASDPTLDNDGDALIDGALYFDTTLNVMKFYDLGNTAWKQTTPTSADQTNIDAAVANASNINAVAAIDTDVTAVAGISSDVTTVAADGTDIGTVAGISANVTTVAGISSDVTTVAGISGDVSSVAAQVIGYDFSTTTAMADPGSGNVRFNNATVASVTAIAIDDLDKNGVDQSAYIALFDDSTNTVKGTLVFRTGGGDVATFNITGLTDNTGWFQIAVTHVASSGTFADGEDTFIGFTRAGDKGADGAGSGDVSGPGSATDNAVVRWDGTSGQLVQNSGVTINDSGDLTANNLSGTHSGASSGTNTGDEVAASESTAGVVELATTAEAEAGTDTVRAVTPAGAAAAIAALAVSGATDAEKSNIMLNSFRIEEQGGLTVQGMVDGVSDVFTDESGVDTATSTDEVYNAAGDYYENLGGYGANLIPAMTSDTAPSGTVTYSGQYNSSSHAAWHAFAQDGYGGGYYWETGAAPGWIAYDFGAGNGVVAQKYTIQNNANTAYHGTAWTFDGWDGSAWVTLDTQTGIPQVANNFETYTFSNTTSYEKYRWYWTAGASLSAGELTIHEAATPLNTVLVSDTFTALSQPDTAFVAIWHEDVDACTPNTDFTVEVSRDAGTTWTAGTLALGATLGAAEILTCSIDISAQPAGTSMRWRANFLNEKSQRLRGVGLQWS